MDTKSWMTTREASKYLSISTQQLEKWRSDKTGPSFSKMGRMVRYRREDLDAFAESHRIEAA